MSRALSPLAACLVTGAALYLTRGVLDQVLDNDRAVRIAMLPPWQAFAGFVVLAAILLVLLDRVLRSHDTGARTATLRDLVLPWLGLAVLGLPFAPYAADWLPALQMLAGPFRSVVWLVVAGLMLWVLWQAGLVRAGWLTRRSRMQGAIIAGLVTAALAGVAASRLTRTSLFPAGDEPHYLVIAQSLWLDRDLKIENNHQRRDYAAYYARDLEPHYLTRGSDGEIYSIHPVGLPILLAPVYAVGGYDAVVWAMIAMAAVAAALAWHWAATVLAAPAAATFALAVVVASAPFLLNAFTVYPEIAAALAVMIALTAKRPWVVGLACGVLPWLSTKYAPMSAVLLLLGPGTVPPKIASIPAIRKLLPYAVPYILLLMAWFTFFYVYWGSPWPQAPYGSLTQTSLWNVIFGAPGLLFDQEYGLLPYAPAYILAVTGLWTLWRAGGEERRRAVGVTLVFLSLLVTVGAFRIWWGGAAVPGRPLVSGLLVLALPIAAAFRAAPAGSPRRAAQHVLLLVGAGIAVTLTVAQNGLLISNGRDGTSSLLEWWSPSWPLWSLAPSFIHHEAPTAWLHSAWWLAVAALAAVALGRLRVTTAARAALASMLVFATALLAVALTFPLLPSDPPMPGVDLRARARTPGLDDFDVHVRPAAIIYNPLVKRASADTVDRFTLEVDAGMRTEPQPVRVLHNGRFSLPAGRYRVLVDWSDRRLARPAPLSLQVGRIGPPVQTWTVDTTAASRWETAFELPLDAGFVGFRGSLDLERAIRRITIVPTFVVDRGLRPRRPPILAASRYGAATVYFHDEQLYPEAAGFWTMGGRRVGVTIAPPAGPEPLVLRLHCGSKANRVTLYAHGWSQTLTLVPNEPQNVTIPIQPNGLVALDIQTDDGFVPSQLNPSSQDHRFLGAWIEVPEAER